MSFEKIYGTLLYVCLDKPVKAFVKPGTPQKPNEWKASVVLTDEDYVDELEEYAKQLDTQLSLKKVKSVDFEEKYKCDLPEGAGKNVWILTLRKSTELGKTGKPVPDLYKPKVFEKVGKVLTDITHSKLVGNGSKGALSVDKFDRSAGGSSLYLKNVLVTSLVEYEAKEHAQAGSEFDDDEDSAPVETAKPQEKQKPAKKADMEDDVPF